MKRMIDAASLVHDLRRHIAERGLNQEEKILFGCIHCNHKVFRRMKSRPARYKATAYQLKDGPNSPVLVVWDDLDNDKEKFFTYVED